MINTPIELHQAHGYRKTLAEYPPSVNTGAVEEVKEADSTDIIFRSLLLMIPSLRSKISRLLSD